MVRTVADLTPQQFNKAYAILKAFRAAYTRATDIVMQMLHIPKRWVAEKLWVDNARWQRFKWGVKVLHIMLYDATSEEIQELVMPERRAGSRLYDEWIKMVASEGQKITYCPPLRVLVRNHYPEIGKKYPILLEKVRISRETT